MSELRELNTKEQYPFLDIVKFLLALLIVCAHFISENAMGRINPLIDYLSSLYIIVVPFFFVCSGFLLFRKLDGQDDAGKVKNYCKRVLVMYMWWSALYIAFQIITWFRFGTTREEVWHYLLNAITYSTYKTIWFLPATVIGVLLTYCFYVKAGLKKTFIIAIIFYIVGCMGASYSFVLSDMNFFSRCLNVYNFIFCSSWNGIFNGFPFITLGLVLSKIEKIEFSKQKRKDTILTVVLGVCFVVEALTIKTLGAINVNTLLFLFPFSYYFMRFCLGITIRQDIKTIWLRKMSMDIFLCQRLYLSALPTLFPESFFNQMLIGSPYVGLLFVLTVTMTTAAGLTLLSKRIKWFQQFC